MQRSCRRRLLLAITQDLEDECSAAVFSSCLSMCMFLACVSKQFTNLVLQLLLKVPGETSTTPFVICMRRLQHWEQGCWPATCLQAEQRLRQSASVSGYLQYITLLRPLLSKMPNTRTPSRNKNASAVWQLQQPSFKYLAAEQEGTRFSDRVFSRRKSKSLCACFVRRCR